MTLRSFSSGKTKRPRGWRAQLAVLWGGGKDHCTKLSTKRYRSLGKAKRPQLLEVLYWEHLFIVVLILRPFPLLQRLRVRSLSPLSALVLRPFVRKLLLGSVAGSAFGW